MCGGGSITRVIDAITECLAEVGQIQYENSDQVKVQLYHIHLPKLAATGMIDYDQETGLIQTTEAVESANQVMTAVADDDTV